MTSIWLINPGHLEEAGRLRSLCFVCPFFQLMINWWFGPGGLDSWGPRK